MHLSELIALIIVNENSEAPPIAVAWRRKVIAPTISPVNFYHPASVIGTVLPSHSLVIAVPHFSRNDSDSPGVDIFYYFLIKIITF